MARESHTRKSWTLSLTETDMTGLRADRNRGQAPINNIYSSGLITPVKNDAPAEIIPWFSDENNELEYILQLVLDNPVALGLLVTKASIIHGQGLSLFRKEGGKKRKLELEEYPDEIRDFYELSDLDDWAFHTILDWLLCGNWMSHLFFTKGSELGNIPKKVTRIARLSPIRIRAIKPSKGDIIKEYVVASEGWAKLENGIEGMKRIAAFRRERFFSEGRFQPGSGTYKSVLIHKFLALPGFPVYGVPQFYGARKTLEMANEIPHWHIANVVNMWGIRVRCSVSQRFIDEMCSKINEETQKHFTELEVREYVRDLLKDYCTNPQNVGKVLIDTFRTDHAGNIEKDIIIETIKLDIQDAAYTKLSPQLLSDVTSAMGIDPSLASVITAKGMSSGSEKTQSWNIENAKAHKSRANILDTLRFIHRYNGWDPDLVWGFTNPSLVTKDISKDGKTQEAPLEPVGGEENQTEPTPEKAPDDNG